MKRSLLVGVTVGILSACASPMAPNSPEDAELAIIPTKTNYAVGETLSAQLFNRSATQLDYAECADLEKYQGDKWVHVSPAIGACITLILYRLDANSSRTLEIRLNSTIPSGLYRLRIQISREDGRPLRDVYSPTFQIRDAA